MTKRPLDFSTDVRRIVLRRDGGACARCGRGEDLTVHHRLQAAAVASAVWPEPTPDQVSAARSAANALTLCRECHDRVEQTWPRAMSVLCGYLVDVDELPEAAQLRSTLRRTPVLYRDGRWYWLSPSGRRYRVPSVPPR